MTIPKNTKLIPLTQGKFAIVDAEDYEFLNQWKWFYSAGYAIRNSSYIDRKRITIRMHRLIMNTPDGMETDHISMNTLDNRRRNLRICTKSQNLMNKNGWGKSKYKGVCWHKRIKKWYAQIQCNNKPIYLGYYKTEQEAAIAYNKAAKKYFGEFSKCNLI